MRADGSPRSSTPRRSRSRSGCRPRSIARSPSSARTAGRFSSTATRSSPRRGRRRSRSIRLRPCLVEDADAARERHVRDWSPDFRRVLRVRRARGRPGDPRRTGRRPRAVARCSGRIPRDRTRVRLGCHRLSRRVRGRRRGSRGHRSRPHDGTRRPGAGGRRRVGGRQLAPRRGRPKALRGDGALRAGRRASRPRPADLDRAAVP